VHMANPPAISVRASFIAILVLVLYCPPLPHLSRQTPVPTLIRQDSYSAVDILSALAFS
jgi:hypothetical protein